MDKDLYKFDEPISEPEIPPTQFISELVGKFSTVTAVPTLPPKKLADQIVFYTDSLTAPTVYKLYFYSYALAVWKSVSLS